VTAILVGAVTYGIVFNMDNMTNNLRKFYSPRKESLVSEMQKENGWWSEVGDRFDEFKPSSEKRTPSEWWIPVYAIRHLFQKTFQSRHLNETVTTSEAKSNSFDGNGEDQSARPPFASGAGVQVPTSEHTPRRMGDSTGKIFSRFRSRDKNALGAV
jgi:hypothetical protein